LPSQSVGFWFIPRRVRHRAQIPQRETLSLWFRFRIVFPTVGRRFAVFPAANKALQCTKSASDRRAPLLRKAQNAGYAFRVEDVSLR
jgi:hypothetical protein